MTYQYDHYICQHCGKLIGEDEGITTMTGEWVCDSDTCRTLDDDNQAHLVTSKESIEILEQDIKYYEQKASWNDPMRSFYLNMVDELKYRIDELRA